MPRGKAKSLAKPSKEFVEEKRKIEEQIKLEKAVKELFDGEPEKETIIVDKTEIETHVIEIDTIKNVKAVTNIKCDTFGMIKNGNIYQVDTSHPVISRYIDDKLMIITSEQFKIDWNAFISTGKKELIRYFEKQRRIYKANAEKNGNKDEVEALKSIIDNKINEHINDLEVRHA